MNPAEMFLWFNAGVAVGVLVRFVHSFLRSRG